MKIHEDSIPFRFTPDGLDETSIDALIEQAYAQVNDTPSYPLTDVVEPHPAHRRTGQPSSNGEAA